MPTVEDRIKVVVTDGSFGALEIERGILEPLGCQVVAYQRVSTPAELAPLIADADYVLTRFAPVDSGVIAAIASGEGHRPV
jgi:D-3-phosphoglycerate dehydrogenase